MDSKASSFLPLSRMRERLAIEQGDSDAAYFSCLMYYGEMVIKLVVAAMVAAVDDDRDRHRYRQVHRLVRADGLGEWTSVLDDIFTGPTAQFLAPEARPVRNQYTQRVNSEGWQHAAAVALHDCLTAVGVAMPDVGSKVACSQIFQDFVTLRNKTRGHGAVKPDALAQICGKLRSSTDAVSGNLLPFEMPWAYVKRNLSGKYRVTLIGGDGTEYDAIRKKGDVNIENGVYLHLGSFRRVELVESDPDLTDFFLPNGGFTDKRHELLSYITGDCHYRDSKPFLLPASQLPPSETDGLGKLDVQGSCFGNLPAVQKGYVSRAVLESDLRHQLELPTHPVVTLNGPGGIGKTSLAVEVLWQLAREQHARYGVVVWFSARDIDLLPHGPKVVRPQGVTLDDFASEFVALLEPAERNVKGFRVMAST